MTYWNWWNSSLSPTYICTYLNLAFYETTYREKRGKVFTYVLFLTFSLNYDKPGFIHYIYFYYLSMTQVAYIYYQSMAQVEWKPFEKDSADHILSPNEISRIGHGYI